MPLCNKKLCACSVNQRLALDVLQITLCNIIHFGMEFSHLYLQNPSVPESHYLIGEIIWYGVINCMGFVAQLLVLFKVLGCRFSPHCLRLYYMMSFLVLVTISTVVTAIAYARRPTTTVCTHDNDATAPDGVKKECVEEKKKSEVDGKAEPDTFPMEFAMFVLSCFTAFLYLYSFVLTCCIPKKKKKGSKVDKDGGEDGDDESTSTAVSGTVEDGGGRSSAVQSNGAMEYDATNPFKPGGSGGGEETRKY